MPITGKLPMCLAPKGCTITGLALGLSTNIIIASRDNFRDYSRDLSRAVFSKTKAFLLLLYSEKGL